MTQRKAYVQESKYFLLKMFAALLLNSVLIWAIAHFYVKYYGGVWPDTINLWKFVKGEIGWLLPLFISLGGITSVLEIFRQRKGK